jgi:hypothetical protein
MSEPLIHIGLHRTGSTWIQKALLPHADVPLDDAWPDRGDIARKLIMPSNAGFSASVVRIELEERCREVRERGHQPVISHERFSGNPSSGGIDMSRTARRLQQVAPDAKILIILREQQSHLESIWCQAVRIGLFCSAEDYLRPYDPGDFRVPHFEPSYLLYDEILGEYVDRFGRDRVLALDFAHLRRDPKAYVNAICSFCGTSSVDDVPRETKYARPHPLEAAILRRGNLLHRRTSMNPGPPLESAWMFSQWRRLASLIARHAPAGVRDWFSSRHSRSVGEYLQAHDRPIRESNRRLRDKLGVDLIDDKWRF